jgi:hypothetical protein
VRKERFNLFPWHNTLADTASMDVPQEDAELAESKDDMLILGFSVRKD